MRQKPRSKQSHGEKVVKDISRAARKQYLAEEKIRIVLDGLRGGGSIRKSTDKRDVLPVVPMRKPRKKRVGVDHSLYRLGNLIKRCFNELKNAGRVATRHGKTSESFKGLIDITSIHLWLRQSSA